MNKKLLIAILLIMAGHLSFSQEAKKARGDEQYDKFAYIKASELYKNLADKGYESKDLYSKLGDTYYYNARYAEAGENYEKMFSYGGEIEPVYYFRYAQCLKSGGHYDRAEKTLKQFYELIGQPEGPKSLSEELADIERFSGRYEIADVGINGEYADFGTAFGTGGDILFASARDTGVFVRRTHKWNEKPFLKLYSAMPNSDGTLREPKKVKGDINTRYHQTSPAVSKDGKIMYFTRNNYTPGKYKKGEDGTNHLKVYRAHYRDGEWTGIEDLSINSDDYSTAHSALSPDGKQLYFASDRPGTRGMSDLFVAEIRTDGSLGPAQELGDAINTRGRETFPFMSESGILYFASDGHPGFGGLDIFAAIKDSFGNYQVVNVGKPVNSSSDDFAYIIDEDTKRGYFSSNRGDDMGFDNIYTLLEKEPLSITSELCGHVRDSLTKEQLADTHIIIYDEENHQLKTLQSDGAGNFCVEVQAGKNYNLRFNKESYQPHEEFVTRLKANEKRELLIELNKEDIAVTTGDDLTKKLGLKPIYFDFDKHGIRKDSEIELGKVIEVMQQYPDISIDVRSHTDSRGSDIYNMQLSERRAKATVDYIVNKGGISRSRITGKGYGKSRLINHCTNGVSCTAEEHQLNRRSEFILIKM